MKLPEEKGGKTTKARGTLMRQEPYFTGCLLPPVAMQVILTLEPSLYGPSIWCGMMVPLSSRIKSFSGGTETDEYRVIKISDHLAVFSDTYLRIN